MMTSSGTDSSSSLNDSEQSISSISDTSNYLVKKWHKKLIHEEQPLIRRPRSETVPTQPLYSLDMIPNNNNTTFLDPSLIQPTFGSSLFNPQTTASIWGDTPVSEQLLTEDDHTIASTFASLGLDEDTNRRTIHTSHSYSSLQFLSQQQQQQHQQQQQQQQPFIKRHPSIVDFRLQQGNRPRAMSAVDPHRQPEENLQKNIWQSEIRHLRSSEHRRPFLRNSTSSADLLEMMARQRNTGSPIYHQEDTDAPWTYDGSSTEALTESDTFVPSRSLWIGQLDLALTTSELNGMFSKFGAIESIRILPDRECAFINYFGVEEALRARDVLVNKMGSRLGNTIVKVGFGKPEAVPQQQLYIENVQEPTRALWVGNIPNNTTQVMLVDTFSTFGAIESVRVLPHKNCAFINFFNVEEAVMAKRALHNREIMGQGTGAVKTGFAKVPSLKSTVEDESGGESKEQQQQQMMMYMMTELMNNPNMIPAIITERKMIMQEFGEDEKDGPMFQVLHLPQQYFPTIPAAPELGQSRKVDISRLREIKKRMDTGHISLNELEVIAMECLDELVELCSDYIGNTVIQRLFERCSEMTKSMMLEKVAPYLGSIGVHKNGTWAAQKIIDTAKLPAQIHLICESIKPYVPALLLDQFGNYVVQCCLSLGPSQNQFIFDAIVGSCWEIAQGRFGARAVRATLESPHVTKRQQKYVAASLVQHALLLSTNANGALLLIWLLDTSGIPGRYRALAPRLLPHLARLCTHKLASLTILKLINQRQEPDARNIILDALFSTSQNTEATEEILHDQVHGVSLIQKILSSSYIELRERQRIAERVKQMLQKLKLQHIQGYKRLMEEINMVMVDSVPSGSLGASIPSQFSINPSLAAALHSKYLVGINNENEPSNPTATMMTDIYAAAASIVNHNTKES
ncbi:hypothetical protein G6F43_010925 [Rhizopus delemar]|nr:hypothetical protein G6F43_010925 [Rhizopus delemar]